jgi:DNA-binding Lrp family transcriptional regulator
MAVNTARRQLLALLQRGFPLEMEPYMALARRLTITERAVFAQIRELKDEGIVRQISPVMDARKLGYQSTLVAMEFTPDAIETAARTISLHPGVSHLYEREHRFNLWLTLSMPPGTDVDAEVPRLKNETGAAVAFSLPVLKLYKIGAYFDADTGGQADLSNRHDGLSARVDLNETERRVINAVQRDLPLTSSPFEDMAREAGLGVETFLEACRGLIERGVIRRYGASVNHRRIGFQANAMTCFIAPPDRVDAAGAELASLKAVSHCYQRQTNSWWPYNLFAMAHSATRDECEALARTEAGKLGLPDYVLLYSTREFKKTRIIYRV